MEVKAYKTVPFEVKDADANRGIISGYGAVFGNIDDGLDVIEPGAFAKAIAERGTRIKACFGHDLLKVVGVVQEIREDSHGLYTVTKLALDSFWGKEVHALATTKNDAGAAAIDEMSIGYVPVQASIDPQNGIRRLSELKLYEYSFVPIGMNPLALVTDAKSLAALYDAAGPNATAETLAAMIDQFASKAGRVLSGKNREIISAAHGALARLLDATEPGDAKAIEPLPTIDAGARAAQLRRIQLDALRHRARG